MTVHSTVDLPSGRVCYVDLHPDGTAVDTVVLLHGGGVDSASLSWGEVAPQLATAGYRVITPDHPGFGDSPLPSWPLTQRALVAYVGEFVDALGLDRYAVGGLSLGGGMAIGHVLERPRQVSAVLLLASYGIMPRLSDGPLAGAQQAAIWAMLHTGVLGAFTRRIGWTRAALTWSVKHLIHDPAQRTPALLTAIETAVAQQGFDAFEQWQRDEVGWRRLRTDYTAQLESLARPVLIVHGDQDRNVPVARARLAADLIPDAELKIIDGAGHWVQRDQPEVVIAAMLDFLRRRAAG